MSKYGFRYTGEGQRISYGVPTRDLSATEFAALTPLDQRRVTESDLYDAVTAAEAKKAEDEARKAAEAEAKADADTDGKEG